MVRLSKPPRRFHASHDEHVPSLCVLQRWNALPSLPVCVTDVPGKGLGVVARRSLPAGTVVAEYNFRVVKRATCPPGDYRVEVTSAQGLVGKIDARSFGPPTNGLAQVGPLMNEPSKWHAANCERSAGWLAPAAGRAARRRGSFVLVTRAAVPAGAELTWDYGASYGRRAYEHAR